MYAPAFSVVIPCYNCEMTLIRSVRSVQAQTFTDVEILLVDDGSSDKTLGLAQALAHNDDRILVVSQRNAGAAATRNRAVAFAKGRLIAFLDADDWWHPGKLAAHHALHAARPELDASFAQIAFMAKDGHEPLTRSSVPQGLLSIVQVLRENPVCTMSNAVVRADSFRRFGPFRESLTHSEDQEWLARMVFNGARIMGIDEELVAYRTNDGGLSSDLEKMYDGWRAFAGDYASSEVTRQCEAVYCRYLARRALRLSNAAGQALKYTLRGLHLDAGAFLSDPRRGLCTALGALLAPMLPPVVRTRIFA
ncbi:glycosyl transferase family 2 [Novosphingobium nitrogenifigens DSM 19370]|uniref:Glycosyl transferase family 2 n=1 Tax=Novosphingobium nitrogenifigens DSM 19370 TaxID=983920 RepID=F1Z8D9_9SPHN|nr:glycosyltransferase [Novosphingobium nitrogenifigens]EGD59086.1 glycosyl transferase family 2 [Novosphingobium nitrogenifigens DSM 19370]